MNDINKIDKCKWIYGLSKQLILIQQITGPWSFEQIIVLDRLRSKLNIS
jgi:hypothetical protein